jgi:LmbE family N-acetylglucosaminyl deacetylase
VSAALVLSPHPDDEAIGPGGSILGRVERGEEVHVAFLTSGEHGCRGLSAGETRRVREAEAARAAAALGVATHEFWRQPDGGLRATRALVERLAERVRDTGARVLYAPHEAEMHPDHRAACRLALRARDALGPDAPEVLLYEVWTPLQRLDEIVDITDHVEGKRAAIRCYASQCAVMDFEGAALALARYRGEMHSWPGGPYAEAFAHPRSGPVR